MINYGEDSSPNLSASAPRLVVTELGKSAERKLVSRIVAVPC